MALSTIKIIHITYSYVILARSTALDINNTMTTGEKQDDECKTPAAIVLNPDIPGYKGYTVSDFPSMY